MIAAGVGRFVLPEFTACGKTLISTSICAISFGYATKTVQFLEVFVAAPDNFLFFPCFPTNISDISE